jgi:hypothetical protein
MLEESGVRLGIAGGLLVVVLCALCWSGAPDKDGIELTATALLALTVTRWGGLLLGFTCWALLTGFVTNRFGRLTFTPHDLLLLGASVAVGIGAAQVSGLRVRAARKL